MNPVILYDNRFVDGTPVATDTAAGFNVNFLLDRRAYTFWKGANSSGPKYLSVDCGVSRQADALAITGHNLATISADVSVESSSDGTNWTQRLAPFTPPNDKTLMRVFTGVSARHWRIKLDSMTDAPIIADLNLGIRVTFPFPPDIPFIPYEESVEADTVISKAGHILGSTVRFFPIRINARFSNVDRSFVDTYFRPFWENFASYMMPFYWSWDLDIYPDDVFFVKIADGFSFKTPLSILGYADEIELELEGLKERLIGG